MSKKNYTNYSKPETIETPVVDENIEKVVAEEVIDEIISEEPIEDSIPEEPVEVLSEEVDNTVNEEKNPRYVYGVVKNCETLRVRKIPSSDGEILTIIDKGTELEIDLENSTDEFYNVCTATGINGYCMKKFIILQ